MDRLEKRAQLRLWPDQGQIFHGRAQRRENELGAGMADNTLPVGASVLHQELKLLGCGAAAEPLSEDANDHIEWMNPLCDHFTPKSDRTRSMARSRSP